MRQTLNLERFPATPPATYLRWRGIEATLQLTHSSNSKIVIGNVILLDFAIDGGDDGARQFDTKDERVDQIQHGVEWYVVRSVLLPLLTYSTFHHLLAQLGFRERADFVLNFSAFRGVHFLGGVFRNDLAHAVCRSRGSPELGTITKVNGARTTATSVAISKQTTIAGRWCSTKRHHAPPLIFDKRCLASFQIEATSK